MTQPVTLKIKQHSVQKILPCVIVYVNKLPWILNFSRKTFRPKLAWGTAFLTEWYYRLRHVPTKDWLPKQKRKIEKEIFATLILLQKPKCRQNVGKNKRQKLLKTSEITQDKSFSFL